MNPFRRTGFSQIAALKLIPQAAAPPADATSIAVYDKAGVPVVRSKAGIESVLVPGVDGAGIKVITAAMSPYSVLPTDEVLAVNSAAGAVNLVLPVTTTIAVGKRYRVIDRNRQFATNNVTLTGTGANINGAATLVLSTTDGGVEIIWGGVTWERDAVAAGAMGAHASLHRAGGADDLLSAPGAIGGGTPAAATFTALAVNTSLSLAAAATIASAAGAGSFDLSLWTGAFKTSTGQHTFGGDIALAAGKDIVYAAGAGEFDSSLATGSHKFGHSTATIGLFGATPVARAAAITQTYSTASRTVANPTSHAGTDSSGGSAQAAGNLAAQAVSVTGVDGTGSNAASKADVDTALGVIRNNCATLHAEFLLLRADVLGAKQNLNSLVDDTQAIGINQ